MANPLTYRRYRARMTEADEEMQAAMSEHGENGERTGEYGIGRVPADVDPVEETQAEIEAAETMARMRPAQRVPVEMGQCDYCGQRMPRYLLMSASIGTACPSCYDDARGWQVLGMKHRGGTGLPPGYRFIIDPERPREIIVQRPDGSEMPPQSRRYLATAAAAQDFFMRERESKRRKAAEEAI